MEYWVTGSEAHISGKQYRGCSAVNLLDWMPGMERVAQRQFKHSLDLWQKVSFVTSNYPGVFFSQPKPHFVSMRLLF